MMKKDPEVALICLDAPEKNILAFLSFQEYDNFEIVRWDRTQDTYFDLIEYMKHTNCKYICFFLLNHQYHSKKIRCMVERLERKNSPDIVIVQRNIIDTNNVVIAHPDTYYYDSLENTVFDGSVFLKYNIEENINLFGNLATIMCKSEVLRKIQWTVPDYKHHEISRLDLLVQLLLNSTLDFILEPYVNTVFTEVNAKSIQEDYFKMLLKYGLKNKKKEKKDFSNVLKKMTFFYTDKGEYYNIEPIAEEAKKRGYDVRFSDNILETAEIGVYCQHVCYPQNSKMSLVLLHDMSQGHNRWPNIWELEHWDTFDVGILPGKRWTDMWKQCSGFYYSKPRVGVYEFGYPKGDIAVQEEQIQRAKK